MQLQYTNKKTSQEIFDSIPNVPLEILKTSNNSKILIQANNLLALKQLIDNNDLAGKIDLVYIFICLFFNYI